MAIKPLYCIYGKCVIQQRYILTAMTFLAIITFYSVRLCLNIALTEIAATIPTPPKDIEHDVCPDETNNTIPVKGGSYNWTEEQQGIILLSFFPGYIITHIPGGLLADKFGGKYIIAIAVFVSALVSFITPVIITSFSWLWLVFIRFVLGLVQGPLFPAITTLLARWIPERERSTLGGFVYSGVFFGSVTGNLISGLLMAFFQNWPVVFYAWGVVSLVWLVIFVLTCYSAPSQHPYITPEEAELLQTEIGEVKVFKTPWKKILTDPAVLALVTLQIGHDWITYTFITDLPKFFKDVLKFNVAENGVVTAVSFGLMWVFSIICGWISDYFTNNRFITIMKIRKVYAAISAIGPASCSVLAVYMGCNRVLVVSLLWIGMVLMGPWFPGPKVNTLDISLHFSGVIMSITNGAGVVSGILTPYLVAVIAPNGTLRQWQNVFWISLFICLITLLVFLIWGSGERSTWDSAAEETENR